MADQDPIEQPMPDAQQADGQADDNLADLLDEMFQEGDEGGFDADWGGEEGEQQPMDEGPPPGEEEQPAEADGGVQEDDAAGADQQGQAGIGQMEEVDEEEVAEEEEDGGARADDDDEDAAEGQGPVTAREKEEAERMASILASMTEEQIAQHEAYRRSKLSRPAMTKVVQAMLGAKLNDRGMIALCGIGKMFVGELVEMARHLASVEGHTGPLLPKHVRRAYMQLQIADRGVPSKHPRKRMFQ